MKNSHRRTAARQSVAWAHASSTWWRSNSVAHPSVPPAPPAVNDPARASVSSSRDSTSSERREPKPRASILLFPLRRAPERDGDGPGGNAERGKRSFEGRSILVVEDDFIVAFDMQTLLEEHGARVLGPASSVSEARAILARETPNLAVLDVNLNGEYVFPIADELRTRQVPFV